MTVLAVETEGGEGSEIAARPDADFEPMIAQQIEHDGIFGNPHRQLERQGDDARAEPDARGRGGGVREEHERCRQAALGFMEVMLRDPRRVETAALGLHDLCGCEAITFCRVRLVEQAREEAQPLGHARDPRAKIGLMQGPACLMRPALRPLVQSMHSSCCDVIARREDVVSGSESSTRTFYLPASPRLPRSAPRSPRTQV